MMRMRSRARGGAAMAALVPLMMAGLTTYVSAAPIHNAASNGDVARVRALLKNDPRLVHAVDPPSGFTPLHSAADKGHDGVVKVLLAAGADVNAKRPASGGWYGEGATPLHLASMGGWEDAERYGKVVKTLLDAGADVAAGMKRMHGPDRLTPLHLAAEFGCTKAAKLLIERGADVNALDVSGSTDGGYPGVCRGTPLHYAVVSDAPAMVKLLIGYGARVNDPSLEEQVRPSRPFEPDPTLRAIQDGLQEFLDFDSDPVRMTVFSGLTPLHKAAQLDKLAAARALLACGADVHAQAEVTYVYGSGLAERRVAGGTRSPLEMARASGSKKVAALLEKAEHAVPPTPSGGDH